MNEELITRLRAQLDDAERSVIRYRDGHAGPCVNYEGQNPDAYDEYESCARHLATASATPYRDVEFGLREIEGKRKLLDLVVVLTETEGSDPASNLLMKQAGEDILGRLAGIYSLRPGYREEWSP